MENLTIKSASEKLKANEITSAQITEYYLSKIKKLNPKINAFISVLETATAEAQKSDERRRKGQILSVLDGIPIAIKDNMAMRGTKTTAASKMLENYISPYDAEVIKKLKSAGAVILGKTNMDEFAMGSSTENSAYGPTKNPHDTSRVAGGSSGGSAAVVAADLCVAALGSDTGGSIRQPASFCGVTGFKPTYGMVSRYGLFAMASSLDQIGPIAKTAEDAEILFDIIKGYDKKDSTSIEMSNVKCQITNEIQMSKIKIGIPKEYFAEGLDTDVKKVIEDAIEKLKKLGAEIIDINLAYSKYALSCYYIIMPVEVSSNLNRYTGVGFGLKSRVEGFGAEAKRRIMLGAYASSAGYANKFYKKAQKVRALIKKDFDEAFKKVDFIVGPVAPTTAFKIGEKTKDPLSMYLEDIYTIAVNLAGLPAISIPANLNHATATSDVAEHGLSLPVGLHIIGPQLSDNNLLNIAKIFESNHNELSRAKI